MKPHILLISISSDITTIARNISNELNIPITIKEGGFMQGGHLYAKAKASQYDVIISVGGTGAVIRKMITNTIVLTIPLYVDDILKSLMQAISYQKPICLISFDNHLLEGTERILHLMKSQAYHVFPYADARQFEEQTVKIKNMADCTIIGSGNCIRTLGLEKNCPYMMINPSYTSIKRTILEAQSIVERISQDKLQATRLDNIINHSIEGIIAVNKAGEITIYNTIAENIFGKPREKILHHQLVQKSIPDALKALFETQTEVTNQLIKINGNNYLMTRTILKNDNELEETTITLQDVTRLQRVEHTTRMQLHNKGFVAKIHFPDIIGSSKPMRQVVQNAIRYSHTTATVLIEGETGTGKELFAQSIHNESPLRNGPFVAINCAALPESLLESELFGYVEGAFTGARRGGKPGLFELAHNGTIFLDEIGSISPAIQSRLLRVLQEKEIMRIGGTRVLSVNVRVLAATNRNLYELARDNKFRSDLYFRLSVLNLRLPPLRQRLQDLDELTEHFRTMINEKYGLTIKGISPAGLAVLKAYAWPGNVRELEAFLEKLFITANTDIISHTFVQQTLEAYTGTPLEQQTAPLATGDKTLVIHPGTLKNMELEIIQKMLPLCHGSKKALASTLDVSRSTLWYRLKELEMKTHN